MVPLDGTRSKNLRDSRGELWCASAAVVLKSYLLFVLGTQNLSLIGDAAIIAAGISFNGKVWFTKLVKISYVFYRSSCYFFVNFICLKMSHS